LAYR